ncbi:MAG: phenylalanine--tRNA ligase subunit alpha [candidate division KSB1 bacterium]|nr:phenylalanine--tRNA ligase subunit alpha [candidate division KSB1 bacterium]MDQ7062708.1 phenylalanine--tRNA ligase subunit alpha [candidate division KSB1 bacterium]
MQKLDALTQEFEQKAQAVKDDTSLQALRVEFLGKKGHLTQFFRHLAELPPEQKPLLGQKVNQLKNRFQERIQQISEQLQSTGVSAAVIDVTLPGNRPFMGRLHPLMQILDEIKDIFKGMGFTIEMGPEAESDYYNFEALNIPPDHPSRDLQDTFYLAQNQMLLRTHTSPVQIRTMESRKPPIRIIAPGRCFRNDTPDATHSPMFHQVEGLVVDEGVSFADLKGVLLSFMQKLFGKNTKIRFRPSFFPFTEPSAEYDVSCIMCGGKGCRVCKDTGWLEISGAGMVDPAVFGFVDYDAEKYTGYAFGMGVERIAMLKYQIGDIRLFYENDVRFLTQF